MCIRIRDAFLHLGPAASQRAASASNIWLADLPPVTFAAMFSFSRRIAAYGPRSGKSTHSRIRLPVCRLISEATRAAR